MRDNEFEKFSDTHRRLCDKPPVCAGAIARGDNCGACQKCRSAAAWLAAEVERQRAELEAARRG